MKKKWILPIITALVLIVSLWMCRNILCVKSPHGINQTRAFYYQPEDSIDVLAIGSSHVHCGINPAMLWNFYGMASYDFSAAEQPLWETYYYLVEAYKYQKPKVVVLDVFSAAIVKDDYHYDWMTESFYGMRPSLNKLEMLKASAEEEYYRYYIPDFYIYHTRYENLNKEDFANIFGGVKEKKIFKGFTPGFQRADQSLPFGGWKEFDDYGLSAKSEEYLRKIIELTKENGSELMIVVIPYNMNEHDRATYEQIAAIAEENSVRFINYNDYLYDIGIDVTSDFNDHSHLNYWGSVKFSDYLGRQLKEYYDIPDRTDDPKYSSWEEYSNQLLESVRERL